MYEKRHNKILPVRPFIGRVIFHIVLALAVIGFSLFIGIIGYAYFEQMEWIDAFENAAMILSGMGPVSELYTWEGKLFAGAYAIFSGIVFLISIAIILAPLVHRFLHRFLIKDVQ